MPALLDTPARTHTPPGLHGVAALSWFTQFVRDPVRCLWDAYRELGPLSYCGSVMPWKKHEQKSVLALGPEYNRLVLGDIATYHTSAQTRGGPASSALRRVRFGLTAMNGEKHRQQRQQVIGFFAKKAIDSYHDEVVAGTDRLLHSWPTGCVVDASGLVKKMMLHLSARILFGRENPAQSDRLGDMIGELFNLNWRLGVFLFPFNLPGTPMRRLLRHAEKMERELKAMIRARRRNAECGMRNAESTSSIPHSAFRMPHSKGDLLDLLVRCRDSSEGQMTDADLLGQATILFAASYETQANALTWTLFLLSQHPEVLANLCDELWHVLQWSAPSLEDMDRLPYLEAVLKESMRILPPVPFTIRIVSREAELGGVALRPRDRVICSHFITHHLPELYEEPERFWPERWFGIDPNQYEYLPFSAGPRWCIGKNLAMAMMKIVLARLVQKWRFTMAPHARIDRYVSVTMGPRHGMPMVLAPQDRRFEAVPVTGNVHEMVKLDCPGTAVPGL
ncbi:MAG TPA: cytochrome P450 [Gemmataceae bacterium]|nr:cytochrome P450 [Gemmataceae bacterium]